MNVLKSILELIAFVVFGIPLLAFFALAVYAAMMMIMYGMN